jgi:hypothetical protein
MSTVVVASIEYPDGVVVLLGETSEKLAEARLVVLSHFRSGCHDGDSFSVTELSGCRENVIV